VHQNILATKPQESKTVTAGATPPEARFAGSPAFGSALRHLPASLEQKHRTVVPAVPGLDQPRSRLCVSLAVLALNTKVL